MQSEMPTIKDKPLGVSMIICDQIITEEGTHKKSLIGTFNSLSVKSFPCSLPRFFVFTALTNGSGSYNAKLRCTNETISPNTTFFELEGQVQFRDPMETVEMGFKMVNLTFPSPGVYCFELHCDDELILQRRIKVAQRKDRT